MGKLSGIEKEKVFKIVLIPRLTVRIHSELRYTPADSELFEDYKDYKKDCLSKEAIEALIENSLIIRSDILKMTTLAGSGHPSGSLSITDIINLEYACSRNSPDKLRNPRRDRFILSAGHLCPSLYSTLAHNGYFSVEILDSLRILNSIVQGHVHKDVPGIEYSSGCLGQGLSWGVAKAYASKVKDLDFVTFVNMSDGEQTKGQVQEARDLANKLHKLDKLSNLNVVVDANGMQICGKTDEVMPISILDKYKESGWKVIQTNGHNFAELYCALKESYESHEPSVVIAKTEFGCGVDFMEDPKYHGTALTIDQYFEALNQLGVKDNNLIKSIERRKELERTLVR